MTTPAAIAPNKLIARVAWLALILATLYVCYFSHLGAIGFVGPDEPRYAWIARDMAETGDWVTPRLYGKPWFEKPPLYYWGAAICFKLFGVSEVSARLPSAISALLATLAMAWLAWRIYGAETARWLLLLLPTSVGMIGFSHAAATDMPFSAMLTIAMVCAAIVLGLVPDRSCGPGAQHAAPLPGESHAARRRWVAAILFGFFLGLAVLAKGPVGVILCGGAVFFWALFTKRWRDAFRLLHPAAIATFCVTALPWYILCARRNPDFFRIFIIEHNFKRFLTPEFQHIQPFWFYVPVFFVSLFPWSFLAVLGVIDLWRGNSPRKRSFPWLLLSWSLFTVSFFTISKSKLPGYVLPAVPPVVLLATALWIHRQWQRWEITAISVLTGGLTLICAVVLFFRIRRLPAGSLFAEPWAWRWIAGIACAGLLLCFLALTRRKLAMALAVCILVVAGLELSNRYLLPQLDRAFSTRQAIPLLALWNDEPIRGCVYELDRSRVYGLNFYAHREIPECAPPLPALAQAIVSEKGVNDLLLLEKEQPERGYVRISMLGKINGNQNIYLVWIWPRLPANAPGGGKPE